MIQIGNLKICKMAEYLTGEKKKEIFAEFGGTEKNTGSTEAQIALLTFRINELSKHLHKNQKDHSCRRALLNMVGKRKRFLKYVAKKDIIKYRELVAKLGLRK